MVQNGFMPRKPKNDAKKVDREQYRKPARPVRVREVLYVAAEDAAASLAQDVTQFTNDAIREKLERMGRWPAQEAKKVD